MKESDLSVVMPNYNHAQYLPNALDAILAQSIRPKEILVIDDCSTDNSISVLRSYAEKRQVIRLIENRENKGVIANINFGLEQVSGKYVYFAAADDRVLPGFFEKTMNMLAQYPQAGVCSGLLRLMDNDGQDKGMARSPVVCDNACFLSKKKAFETLARNDYWILGVTAIFETDALKQAGGFLPELHSVCDVFAATVVALEHGACFIPEPLAIWRLAPGGYTASTLADDKRQWEIVLHTDHLMRTRYAHLFPKAYVRHRTREKMYGVGVATWFNVRRRQEDYVSVLAEEVNPEKDAASRVFVGLMRASGFLQACIVRMYFFGRYGSVRAFVKRRLKNRRKQVL